MSVSVDELRKALVQRVSNEEYDEWMNDLISVVLDKHNIEYIGDGLSGDVELPQLQSQFLWLFFSGLTEKIKDDLVANDAWDDFDAAVMYQSPDEKEVLWNWCVEGGKIKAKANMVRGT